jgi:hypothetical protein
VAERRHIAGILACVDRDAHVSQRRLASELGIALGLVNLYLKRCAKKGLIKVQQVPPRRYGYYLTAKGFTEKSRLTVEYLSWSLTFFRRARGEYGAAMSDARERGWGRVGLAGCSDLAEIASMLAADHKVVIGVVWSPGAAVDKLAGVRVVADLDSVAGQVDGWIVTAIEGAQEVYDAVVGKIGPERVLAPALLSVRVASPRATKPRGQR